MDLVQIKCPSCGGEVNISKTSNEIFCNFCGNKFVVSQVIQNTPDIGNYMTLAQSALEAGSYDEATNYFNKVLEIDPNNCGAWVGKGQSLFANSTLGYPKIVEMADIFKKAYDFAPQEKKEAISTEIKMYSLSNCQSFFNMAKSHYKEYKGKLDGTKIYDDFHRNCTIILMGLDKMIAIPEESGNLTKKLCELGIFVLDNSDWIFKKSYRVDKKQEYQSTISSLTMKHQEYLPNLTESGESENLDTVYFDVILLASQENKIERIKLLRQITFCDLVEAKNMVENGSVIVSHVLPDEANDVKRKFENLGATVEITPTDGFHNKPKSLNLSPNEQTKTTNSCSGVYVFIFIIIVIIFIIALNS